MSLDAALRAAIAEAIRSELPSQLSERRRLVPLDETRVARRALLAAEKAGELTIYRRGHSAFVEVEKLDAWIMAAPKEAKPEAATDEIGAVIELGDRRRRNRKRSDLCVSVAAGAVDSDTAARDQKALVRNCTTATTAAGIDQAGPVKSIPPAPQANATSARGGR